MKPEVGSHHNKPAAWVEREDIKDALAAIEEHGEREIGERARLQKRLAFLEDCK